MANGIMGLPPGVLSQDQGTQLMGAANDQARQRAISGGLLRAGAGILGGGNLQEGLSQGLLGFSEGYNRELIANRPKVTPLADGAFSQISFPDGRVEVVNNEDVQSFLQKQLAQQNMNRFSLEQFKADLTANRDETKATRERAAEIRPLLQSTNQLIGRYKSAKEIVAAQADPKKSINIPGIGSFSMAAIQGAAPGLAGFFGGDEVAANKFLQELKVAETLANTALTKGAISNAEMALFMSPIPSLTDDREKVWKPWLEKRLPVLEKIQKFYQSQLGEEGTQSSTQDQTSTRSNQSMSGSVFNTPAAVQKAIQSGALKSGDTFKTPDGQIRVVK